MWHSANLWLSNLPEKAQHIFSTKQCAVSPFFLYLKKKNPNTQNAHLAIDFFLCWMKEYIPVRSQIVFLLLLLEHTSNEWFSWSTLVAAAQTTNIIYRSVNVYEEASRRRKSRRRCCPLFVARSICPVSIYILSVNNDRKFNSSRITINRTAVDVAVCEPKVISSYVANIVNMGC